MMEFELNRAQVKKIIEGALLASGEPLSIKQLARILGRENKIENKELKDIIYELGEDYRGRALELQEVASGYRLQVRADLAPWITKLWEERPPRYSRALLETLALIAYKQPVTRAEIEAVRGVTVSSNIVRTLMEREWVRIAGHKEVPGRPALYVTTNKFLDYFNLKSIKELPALDELQSLEDAAIQLELSLKEQEDSGENREDT